MRHDHDDVAPRLHPVGDDDVLRPVGIGPLDPQSGELFEQEGHAAVLLARRRRNGCQGAQKGELFVARRLGDAQEVVGLFGRFHGNRL